MLLRVVFPEFPKKGVFLFPASPGFRASCLCGSRFRRLRCISAPYHGLGGYPSRKGFLRGWSMVTDCGILSDGPWYPQ